MTTIFSVALRKVSFLSISAGLMATTAIGQAYAVVIPSTAEPSQIEKRFENQQAPTPTPKLRAVTPQKAPIPSNLQKQMAQKKFTLRKVVLEGNTVYSSAELSSFYQDKIGKTISILEAQSIARGITSKYRSNGYV